MQDYLEYMAALKGMPKKEGRRRIDALLEQVSLRDMKKKKIVKLSGGMKRRVGIAQALLPGAGIGLSNSFLYGMLNFDFLHLGSASFWNTDAMLVLALVKIPLFIVFAILIYDKKKIRN